MFKIRYSNRWFNFIAGIVWLIGFILVLYVGIRTGQDFNRVAKVRENFNVAQHDTLVLKMSETPINFDEIDEEEDREGEKVVSADNVHNKHRYGKSTYMIGNHLKEKYLLGYAQLNIIKSQSDNVELVIVKEAKGRDKNIANERAKNISYVVKQVGNEVLFDNLFRVNNADKFRVQDVTAILKLPINTVIYLDKSLENLIYDIENVTNTYDGDMINRRWIMTNSGLKCIDCDGINDESDLEKNITVNDEETNDEVKINVNGVNINAKDAQIKMDSNGVKINSKDAKVTIDKHGVHVKSKKEKQ